jgi:flagellar biogenesis protein FliO
MGEPNNSPEKDRERWDEGVRIVNEWNWGRITIYLTIFIVIVIFVSWMFKKRKRELPRTP